MSTINEQNCDVHLQAEIEVLKNALADKHSQLVAMENACLVESDRQVELEDSIIAWQDKYERLYESHKRVQKVNQNLEDKLLKLVDRNAGERAQLTSDVATLSVRLAQANYNVQSLKREIERYKTDMSVAIQLLQCKPDSFVSPKLSSLPIEIQSKVATYMRLDTNSHSDSEGSTSGVGVATASSYHVLPASDSPPPMCPFPPTAMVYSMRGIDGNPLPSQDTGGGGGGSGPGPGLGLKRQSQQDSISLAGLGEGLLSGRRTSRSDQNGVVSPSVMAKFLEDELKSSEALLNSPVKHCDTCVCTRSVGCGLTSGSLLLADLLGDGQKYYNVGTQTVIKGGETNNSLCLRCNNNLNSPSHNNSPYIMKLIKSSDSVISETKSSVSDFLTTPDKNSPNGLGVTSAPPPKKDDLMVNPILSHHRIGDRSTSLNYNSSTSPPSDPPIGFGSGVISRIGNNLPTVGNGTTTTTSNNNKTQPLKKPLEPIKSKVSSTTSVNASKPPTSGESPSYIIKDTDQISQGGSHALQTPSSGAGGGGPTTGAGGGGGPSKFAGGSVGSGLYHAVGSTNSLWSRTSSSRAEKERDGAKIFETFNRNLIKTIKAENPKMSGPRICALRIQNGSSNILLDSLQDGPDADADPLEFKLPGNVGAGIAPTPVIYTRRAKFLDEELLLDDDPSIGLNGAIKTTSLPTASAGVGDGKQQQQVGGARNLGVGQVGPERKDVCQMSTTTSPHSSDRLCTIGEEVNNLLLNTKSTANNVGGVGKPRLDINVNKLEGIEMNSKKSCTQSSSISSEIDIQESAMLRRQQLSRVAEWVQNNSKLSHPENLSNTESDIENLTLASAASLTLVDSLNNNNALSSGLAAVDPGSDTKLIASDIKISHSISNNNSSSMVNNNHITNNNNTFAQANIPAPGVSAVGSRGHSHTSLKAAIASNTAQLDYNSNSHGPLPQYHPAHHLHLQSDDQSCGVDLAQMEYNVKQFLLKQNEWSAISRRLSSSTTSGTIDPQQLGPPSPVVIVKEPPVVKKASGRTGGGSFPGMAVAQNAMGTSQFHNNSSKYAINPHRTETNL
uniref:Tight junction-associated protein 1 n=1 Tax=Culex pipiens TaxID=7175 RepID=A0A8D8FIC8_CULPI